MLKLVCFRRSDSGTEQRKVRKKTREGYGRGKERGGGVRREGVGVKREGVG